MVRPSLLVSLIRLRQDFPHDFLSSLVVFLVALPLCMGIAIASGVPLSFGIISGIIGGLIVGPLSGCPLQVSGPAAGLVVLVSTIITKHGVEQLGLLVLIAGIVQVLAGLCRCAHWFRAVPPAVVHGMLSGIGILICVSQFHVMLDHMPESSGLANLCGIPGALVKGIYPLEPNSHHLAAAVGIMTIVILVCWNNLHIKKLRVIPGSLVAVVVATSIAAVTQLPIKHVSLPENFSVSFKMPSFNSLNSMPWRDVVLDGLAIAIIATAETMLTATAIDKVHRGKRTNYDRELFSQGVGNIASGFLGGLPITGVMVRSSANIAAGARSRVSNTLHGLWLLLFVTTLPFLIGLIPTCSLAALLVYTGYKLANVGVARELKKVGTAELVIYVVTVLSIVAIDLLTGVVVGVALSFAKLLYSVSHLEIRIAEDSSGQTQIYLRGTASFLTLPKLAEALESVVPEKRAHLHIQAVSYIDHACLELISNVQKRYYQHGGELVVDWYELSKAFEARGKEAMPELIKRKSLVS